MRVIGTAGHVDHGKSTLVQRLTGMNPDRLAEEQARKLTIDLGFAWFTLPDDEQVGIVDVPGHRDFIENMLAGVGGIDAAILVIAADEGVMPQTREHLAILDLLGVENAIVALTKIDLVQDDEWLDLVELDIADTLADTTLADAPILRVSAKTNSGIDALVDTLTALLGNLPDRVDYNQPRLPVDRVFTVDGFGTVVTGTLSGGTLSVGDRVELQPAQQQSRIRGLQSYKQDIEHALPGSRVAINLSGIDKDEIERGNVIAYPGQLQPTQLIDVQFHYLPDADRLLKHNTEVKFFSGASETMARVRLLGAEMLAPGDDGWLQLRLRDAIPLTYHDRFILRYPSPPQTIGGGMIVNPHPTERHKRFDHAVIEALETRLHGTPVDQVTQSVATTPRTALVIQKQTGLSDEELDDALHDALTEERIIQLSDDTYIRSDYVHAIRQQQIDILTQYHADYPLRYGMPLAEFRQGLPNALADAIISDPPFAIIHGDKVQLASHDVRFSDDQQAAVARLMNDMKDTPTAPPSFADAVDIVGEDVLFALFARGDLVRVNEDVIFTADALDQMTAAVLQLIDNHGDTDAKAVRDHLDSSRKYAIALLEYLDDQRITRRVDDKRVRGSVTVDL